jgi:hypothetical protein
MKPIVRSSSLSAFAAHHHILRTRKWWQAARLTFKLATLASLSASVSGHDALPTPSAVVSTKAPLLASDAHHA